MSESILSLRSLTKSFGDIEIIRGADLELLNGERHALIGPNGAGKSTIFHLVSGNITPTSGEIIFDGRQIAGWQPEAINRLGISRSFQITNIFPHLTTFENLRLAVMRAHGLQYTFWRLIEIAFKDYLVKDLNHPVVKRLRGLA